MRIALIQNNYHEDFEKWNNENLPAFQYLRVEMKS